MWYNILINLFELKDVSGINLVIPYHKSRVLQNRSTVSIE